MRDETLERALDQQEEIGDLAPDDEESAQLRGGYQTGGSGRTACATGEH
jgi:hypothetical protein